MAISGKLTYGTSRASIRVSDSAFSSWENVLEQTAPRTVRALDDATTKIEASARAQWPKGAHDWRYQTGKRQTHSRYQLEHGIRIEPNGTIVGYVRNLAPWAFAIRWGIKSFGRRMGAKVSTDLIFRPGRKAGKPLAEHIAEDLRDAAVGR